MSRAGRDIRRRINLYYHDDITRDKGGTSQLVRTLADELSGTFSVEVFVYSERGLSTYDTGKYRIHRIARPDLPLLKVMKRVPRLRRIYNSLAATSPKIFFRSLAYSNPDCVVCVDSYCGLSVGYLARARGVPFVFRPNDCLLDFGWQMATGGYKILGTLIMLYAALVETLTMRNATLIVSPSARTKSSLDRFYRVGSRSIVWTRVTHSNVTSPNPAPKVVVRSHLGIPQENKVLLFLGTADWYPNTAAIRYILDVLAPSMARESPDATILIVGQGTEGYRLSTRSTNVVVAGTVPDIRPYLAVSDIGIAPMAISGGLNLKLIDYLSNGLVCLASEQAAAAFKPQLGLVRVRMADFKEAAIRLVKETFDKSDHEEIRAATLRLHHSSDAGQDPGELTRAISVRIQSSSSPLPSQNR